MLCVCLGDAERNLQIAQDKVNRLQRDIDEVQGKLNHAKSLSLLDPGFYDIPSLTTTLAAIWFTKHAADQFLEFARNVVNGAGYLADKVAIRVAQEALQAARTAAPGIISVAQTTLDGVDNSTQAIVSAMQNIVEATRVGGTYIALQGAKDVLFGFKSANVAALSAAQTRVDTLLLTTEYITYEGVTTVLAAAKAAVSSLDGLREAVAIPQQAKEFVSKIIRWVQGTGVVDIRTIEVSGTLRGMMDANGGLGRPFKAHVEYVLAGQNGTFDGELDLRQTSAFITAIFNEYVV
jgi:hypothetical protein